MSVKKVFFFGIILASVFVINSLVHSIFTLWQKNNLIISAKKNLVKQEQENQQLKKKLSDVQKPEFLEEQARNKLFLAKSGEGIIVIPSVFPLVENSSAQSQEQNKPNWRKWWEFFF